MLLLSTLLLDGDFGGDLTLSWSQETVEWEKKKKKEEQPNVLKQLMQLANLPNVQKKDLDQQ